MTLLHDQLALGGRWINVDVVGPQNADEMGYLWLNRDDGRNDDYLRAFAPQERDACRDYLQSLSTFARFFRFQRDFRRPEGYQLQAELETLDGIPYARLSMRDACEFISKNDYVDNWQSEMHETVCFWSFSEWASAAERAGFVVHPDSHAYTNQWIVDNRLRNKVELLRINGNQLEPLPFPVSNFVLIAEDADSLVGSLDQAASQSQSSKSVAMRSSSACQADAI